MGGRRLSGNLWQGEIRWINVEINIKIQGVKDGGLTGQSSGGGVVSSWYLNDRRCLLRGPTPSPRV